MKNQISNKQIAAIMAAISTFIEEKKAESEALIISLSEQKNSRRWVSASRESQMMKRVMMQMRATGRA